jgi:protocatechuate 3,4-dioxygenase beta subunit
MSEKLLIVSQPLPVREVNSIFWNADADGYYRYVSTPPG